MTKIIISLGILLYEMAAEHPPFVSDQPEAVVYKIIHEPAPSIVQANPDCPTRLEAIVSRAIEKNPSARYQTMRDLAVDLQSFLEGRAQDGRPTETLTIVTPAPSRRRLISS